LEKHCGFTSELSTFVSNSLGNFGNYNALQTLKRRPEIPAGAGEDFNLKWALTRNSREANC
jgi:hypothetical protein